MIGAGKKHIAVFDVGKTNKKLLIYDADLNLVDSTYQTFEEYQKDGIFYETVPEAFQWLVSNLRRMAEQFDIGAISISAHGGACAFLDKQGDLVIPVLSYASDPGEAFHLKFYREFGDARSLQNTTSTPDMLGLGCLAKTIYFVKEMYPHEFAQTSDILPLPQYYGFMLTGQKAIEHTYLGSHTYLWNFVDNTWSDLFDRLAVRDKFSNVVSKPWDILGAVSPEISRKTGLSPDTVVTVGIHDSNASLLPYLVKIVDQFILLSTGSVCVVMHPTDSVSFSEDELGKIVFYNLSAFSTPVKTSIFLAGLEFEAYTGFLFQKHGQRAFPGFDKPLMDTILNEKRLFILPSIIPFGMFPDSPARIIEGDKVFTFADLAGGSLPEFFDDFEVAYTVLNLSLAIQTRVAIERAGYEPGTSLFLEGGFHKNDVYATLLASMFPSSKLFVTNLEEATAFGAALLGKSALEHKDPDALGSSFRIESRQVKAYDLSGLNEYIHEFIKKLE